MPYTGENFSDLITTEPDKTTEAPSTLADALLQVKRHATITLRKGKTNTGQQICCFASKTVTATTNVGSGVSLNAWVRLPITGIDSQTSDAGSEFTHDGTKNGITAPIGVYLLEAEQTFFSTNFSLIRVVELNANTAADTGVTNLISPVVYSNTGAVTVARIVGKLTVASASTVYGLHFAISDANNTNGLHTGAGASGVFVGLNVKMTKLSLIKLE
jgi:hypothetical protein